ncbi:MAG TPA: pyridoxamine 5'-phosphate oxidase family protein, partial [Erythrobacter sp.]|nr:pyridoxamine 5'-phosphate oxidase family protein [Erythrobacter sp.]
MADFFDALNDKHIAMIAAQPVFFVATAAAEGRINLSPKGYDAFRVLSPNRVAYLDLGGSGNETHAHLVADGRITVMFCNFQQPALILRIYGRGRAVLPQDAGWDALAGHFTLMPGTRQIFDIAVESVQTSCGWGVPFMTLEGERDTLKKAHRQSDPAQWEAKTAKRTSSIDGLP